MDRMEEALRKIDVLCAGQELFQASMAKADRERAVIITALLGNEYGTPGIVKRLDANEKKVEEINRKIVKWSGIAVGAAMVLGFLKDWAGTVFVHAPK